MLRSGYRNPLLVPLKRLNRSMCNCTLPYKWCTCQSLDSKRSLKNIFLSGLRRKSIEEQIGDSLVKPIVEETIEVWQRSIAAAAPQVVLVLSLSKQQYPCTTKTTRNSSLPVNELHTVQSLRCRTLLSIMSLWPLVTWSKSRGDFSHEGEIIRIGHSLYYGQCRVLYPWERRESYSSGVWKYRDQLVKLTNKRRRMAE